MWTWIQCQLLSVVYSDGISVTSHTQEYITCYSGHRKVSYRERTGFSDLVKKLGWLSSSSYSIAAASTRMWRQTRVMTRIQQIIQQARTTFVKSRSDPTFVEELEKLKSEVRGNMVHNNILAF